MNIIETFENLRQKFQQFREKQERKKLIKNMTPGILKDMVNDLAYDVEIVLAIEDKTQREAALKEVLICIEDLNSIIDEVLANVNDSINEFSSADSWMTQELYNRDLKILQKRKDNLYLRKNEVEKLRAKVTGTPANEIVDESEIRYE